MKLKKIIIIAEDGISNQEKEETLKKFNNIKIQFFSFRWIEYCLKIKRVIRDIYEERLPQLVALKHSVPFEDFKGL